MVIRVEVELLRLDFALVVPAPVERQRLVDQERVVHGGHEQLFRGRQTLALRGPDVQRDPRLGQEPQQPHPGVLSGNGGLEELNERDLYFFIKNYFKETYLNDWIYLSSKSTHIYFNE